YSAVRCSPRSLLSLFQAAVYCLSMVVSCGTTTTSIRLSVTSLHGATPRTVMVKLPLPAALALIVNTRVLPWPSGSLSVTVSDGGTPTAAIVALQSCPTAFFTVSVIVSPTLIIKWREPSDCFVSGSFLLPKKSCAAAGCDATSRLSARPAANNATCALVRPMIVLLGGAPAPRGRDGSHVRGGRTTPTADFGGRAGHNAGPPGDDP